MTKWKTTTCAVVSLDLYPKKHLNEDSRFVIKIITVIINLQDLKYQLLVLRDSKSKSKLENFLNWWKFNGKLSVNKISKIIRIHRNAKNAYIILPKVKRISKRVHDKRKAWPNTSVIFELECCMLLYVWNYDSVCAWVCLCV